jgi:hypothetical protein
MIKAPLNAASAAALGGPIRFHLDAGKGIGMLLPHLAALKHLSQRLGKYSLLELHNGHPLEAWTNMFASVRLVTAWQPEPVEVSNSVWFTLMRLAFENVWQASFWTGQQLASLQQELDKVRFLSTNGLIRARWDLRDAHGARYTNDSFNTTIHIILPDSGRTQTIK